MVAVFKNSAQLQLDKLFVHVKNLNSTPYMDISQIMNKTCRPFDRQTRKSMLRVSANLKATKHNGDPDSPRSPAAPNATASHLAQSPGYHSNSDYRPSVVNHRTITTYTDGKRRWLYTCTLILYTQAGSFILSY